MHEKVIIILWDLAIEEFYQEQGALKPMFLMKPSLAEIKEDMQARVFFLL